MKDYSCFGDREKSSFFIFFIDGTFSTVGTEPIHGSLWSFEEYNKNRKKHQDVNRKVNIHSLQTGTTLVMETERVGAQSFPLHETDRKRKEGGLKRHRSVTDTDEFRSL